MPVKCQLVISASVGVVLLAVALVQTTPILPAHLMLKSSGSSSDISSFPLSPSRSSSSSSSSSKHRLPLQPSASLANDIPSVRLHGSAENRLMPKAKDLNETKLRRLLGKDFNTAFMSITTPLEVDNDANVIAGSTPPAGHNASRHGSSNKRGKMPLEIRSLQFQIAGLPARARSAMESRETRRALRLFLWAYSACPVQHTWRDLGATFWPRWVREGQCGGGGGVGLGERSCSIPAGMTCKPSNSTFVSVLWWHCRNTCQWIRIKYPIVSSCRCAC